MEREEKLEALRKGELEREKKLEVLGKDGLEREKELLAGEDELEAQGLEETHVSKLRRGIFAQGINATGELIKSWKDQYQLYSQEYPEIMAGLEQGASYAAYGLQLVGEAGLLTATCNPYVAGATGGTACAASVSFVTANHTGATGWAVDQAVDGAPLAS